MITDEITTISLTPAAASKIKGLLEERNDPDCGLRVFVSGGGCSGLQYGMAFESDPQETDLAFECDGVKVIVDSVSLQYLEGAQVDYVDNPMGGGFAISNPNVVSSCGSCASSSSCG